MISTKDLYSINYYYTELHHLGLLKSITDLDQYSKNCCVVVYNDEEYFYYLPDEVEVLKEFLIAMTLGYNFILDKYKVIHIEN